jgi:hypothetical protein
MTTMETAKVEAEVGKLIAEAGKLLAETTKLHAETAKLQRERYWYPAMVMATVIGATVAITKLIS